MPEPTYDFDTLFTAWRNKVMISEQDLQDYKSDDYKQPEVKPLPQGTKYDGGKLPLDLVDPVAIDGLAAVLGFGAKKYAAHNWRGGIEYTRLIAALQRHMSEILKGVDTDPESGLPHIDHVGCCWMFLSWHMKTRPDMDNRYKG